MYETPMNPDQEEASENKNFESNNSEINYQDPSVNDMVKFLEAVEPYEDENGDIKEIPNLTVDGKFNKVLFAGLMMYKAPQYMLFGNESAPEAINFLKELNEQLHNNTLRETIEYLESQLPYLDAVMDVSDRAFQDFDQIKGSAGNIDWFKDIEKNTDIWAKASQANLLRVKVEVFFTNLVNRTYDALCDEYLGTKTNSNKQLE